MPTTPNESAFEHATIERLKRLGYRHQLGSAIDRHLHIVVLTDLLRDHLNRRYHQLPVEAIEQVVQQAVAPEGLTLERRNQSFQRLLRSGVTVHYQQEGHDQSAHLYLVDYEHPERNDFLIVSQLTVQGASGAGGSGNTRRPDLVIYLNGLPLVIFELKSPWDEFVDTVGAYNQLRHYQADIPQLFVSNAFCVVSDGSTTLHGPHSAGFEWFAPWKSIDGHSVEPNTTGSMKTLIEGLFPKERLLDYVRNFVLHEVVNEQITKKVAKHHQFFAVRFAVQKVLDAMQPGSDGRAGVVWHTQGSGKSLSMAFLVGILRRWPGLNPTVLVQVDRTDLDSQLYDTFVAAKDLVGDVRQASDVDDLRAALRTSGGEFICSTLQKFQRRPDETRHVTLSERRNILVIADEAHRTQYGVLDGFAAYLRQALPNAAFMGFTGTPIDKEDANTTQIFGDYIHTYDMQQAREDNAVVGLYYEARHIPLDLNNSDIDQDLDKIATDQDAGIDSPTLEQTKRRYSAVEQAAGSKDRVARLARDLLDHFIARQAALRGKAMVVCMTRANCVRLYDALSALPGCPELKVVMTGNLAEDPVEWSVAGHITTKAKREAIKERFVNPDDVLKIVIVCDMWLTGFDAPCANTLYIDKPMKGHTLMQAIARVNRIFHDKPGGLLVDYIGIGDQLKAATRKYTSGGGRGALTEDLTARAVELFELRLAAVRTHLPANQPYGSWRDLSLVDLDDLTSLCYGTLASDEALRAAFLDDEYKLSKAFALVSHLPPCRIHFDEVALFQIVRKQVKKLDAQTVQRLERLEQAVQDLVDDSLVAQDAVDIFAVAGLEKPDITILDERFLAGFTQQAQPDLQLRLLARLLDDDIARRRRQNVAQAQSGVKVG